MRIHLCSGLVFSAFAMLLPPGSLGAGALAHGGVHSAVTINQRGFTRIALKKGGSGVELAYKIDGTPEVGKPLQVKIQMTSAADAQVTVRAEGGLQLPSTELVMRSAAGTSSEHQMSVTPLTQGRHYLLITSSAFGRTTASAIAVQVGKDMPMAKPAGKEITMPNGERVISMPAQ